MHDRNTGVSFAMAALWGALLIVIACPAAALPTRIGLVIGNSAYSAFPALPACLESARDLAQALRSLGYQVVERADVTSGGLAAAIDEFAKGMDAAPGASVFVYVCGYAAGMNDRPFLLPVSANIQRPSDVMTQGLLAKAMLDVLVRGQPSRGVLALDLVPTVGAATPVLDTLTALPAPDGVGLIGVITAEPPSGLTALAVALAAELPAPGAEPAALLTAVETRLRGQASTRIAALRMPLVARPLAIEEPLARSAPAPAGPIQSGPQAAAPSLRFPDEDAMTDRDRQRVQEALTRLGYYGASIDGRFGPETRAAIRRFQHELGVAMTGTITGEQAARLVNRN